MKDKLKVSIILLSYNNFNYIFESLKSIFKQTYDNIELIISDDCSNDFDKVKLLKFLKKRKSANIKEVIINQNEQNLGTVKHIEKLRNMSTGDLITSLAADDAYAEKKSIEILVNEYIKHNGEVRVITSLAEMCDSKLRKRKSIFTTKEQVALINSGDSKRLFEELSWHPIMSASGTIVERSVFKEIGSFSDDYVFIEDWSMHLRLARMGIKIICVEEVTYLHRDGGISHGNTRSQKEFHIKYYKDLLTVYLKEVEPYASQMSIYSARRAEQYYNYRKIRYEQDIKIFDTKKIAFYSRKGIVAKGDFALFSRLGAEIAKNPNYTVYCINNEEKEIREKYKNSKLIFVNLNEDNVSMFEQATLIVPVNQIFCALGDFQSLENLKILTLFLHPSIVDWLLLQINKNRFDIDKFFSMIKENQAYAFQDQENLQSLKKHCSIEMEENYFPALVDDPKIKDCQGYPIISHDTINVAWMGRIDGDKVYSIINFLDNIKKLNLEKQINLHIIGDGHNKSQIQINNYAPDIKIHFCSYMYGEQRNQYLINNADFVLAMGVSALDAAILGLPVVVPIVSSKKFDDDIFIYLHQTTKFSIGWSIEGFKQSGLEGVSIKEIISDIYSKGKKQEVSKECYKYTVNNFSVSNNMERVMSFIENTTLTLKECMDFKSIKKQFRAYKLYRKFINKKADYNRYVLFNQKYEWFKTLPIKTKIKVLIKNIKKRIRQ